MKTCFDCSVAKQKAERAKQKAEAGFKPNPNPVSDSIQEVTAEVVR